MPEDPARTTRRRIDWTGDELATVAATVAHLILAHPGWTLGRLLKAGQDDLPPDRRRPIIGWGGQGRLLDAVRDRLAAVGQAAHPIPGDPLAPITGEAGTRRPTRGPATKKPAELLAEAQAAERAAAERAAAAERSAVALRAELDQSRAAQSELAGQLREIREELRRQADLPPEQLLGRLFAAAGRWWADERRAILGEVEAGLDKARYTQELRLQQIYGLIRSGGDGLPDSATLPAAERETYMPLIAVAGLRRDDFSRLQERVGHKQCLRLERVDVSNTKSIGVGAHDRLIVWANPQRSDVPQSLVASLLGRSRQSIRCDGLLADLQALIQTEAQKVRAERAGVKGERITEVVA